MGLSAWRSRSLRCCTAKPPPHPCFDAFFGWKKVTAIASRPARRHTTLPSCRSGILQAETARRGAGVPVLTGRDDLSSLQLRLAEISLARLALGRPRCVDEALLCMGRVV